MTRVSIVPNTMSHHYCKLLPMHILERRSGQLTRAGLAFALAAALSADLTAQAAGPPAAQGAIVIELDPAIWRVFHARNGDHWFGSQDRGVYRYDGKTLVNFTAKDGLSYDPIGGIQEDQAGNLYFTTTTTTDDGSGRPVHGVTRFDGKTFLPLPVPEQASPPDAWKLQPDDLWFGGGSDTGTVFRYDGSTLHRLALPSTPEGEAFLAAHPRSVYPNIHYSPYDVYVHFKDGAGHVWFGTAMLGACRYDGKSFAWIPERELRNGSFGTRSVVEDKDGGFWFCNTQHRFVADPSGEGGLAFRKEEGIRDAQDPDRPRLVGIMSGALDPAGALWLATYGDGVWRYDGKELAHFPVRDGGEAVTLYSISMDHQGVPWLGTHAAGAYRLAGGVFQKFKP